MDQQSKFETLRKSPISSNLEDDECRLLAELAHPRTLSNDDVLMEEGHVDNSLHVIVGGRLAVTKEIGSGDRLTLHMLRPGDLAGELGFIDGRPHTATLRTVGDTTVLSLERERLEGVLEQHPWMVYRLMQNIVQAVHDILSRMNHQHVEMANYISKHHGRY